MPKVEGKNIDECMEICMEDPKYKKEVPNTKKRQAACYAAGKTKFLIEEYKTKNKK